MSIIEQFFIIPRLTPSIVLQMVSFSVEMGNEPRLGGVTSIAQIKFSYIKIMAYEDDQNVPKIYKNDEGMLPSGTHKVLSGRSRASRRTLASCAEPSQPASKNVNLASKSTAAKTFCVMSPFLLLH